MSQQYGKVFDAERVAEAMEAEAKKIEDEARRMEENLVLALQHSQNGLIQKRPKPKEPPNREARPRWPWIGSGKAPEVLEVVVKKGRPVGRIVPTLGQESIQFEQGEPEPNPSPRELIDVALEMLRAQYGKVDPSAPGGPYPTYRTNPLTDTELLLLVVAEQHAEIARLREDFTRQQKHKRFWNILETTTIAILTAVAFILAFSR